VLGAALPESDAEDAVVGLGAEDDGFVDGEAWADADGLVVGVAEPWPPPPPPLPPPLPPPPPVVGVLVGALVGELACAVAGAPGAERAPLCQANATYPPSGMVSEPAATEE
jgi:hypothetical protein